MTQGNEPAFAKAAFYHPDGGVDNPSEGLTKREYFAAMAMHGMAASAYWAENFTNKDGDLEKAMSVATAAADALIAQLNKE